MAVFLFKRYSISNSKDYWLTTNPQILDNKKSVLTLLQVKLVN